MMRSLPLYPEMPLLRGGVHIRIAKPLMCAMTAPFLVPFGIYALSQREWGMAAFFLVPPLLLILIFGGAVRRAGSFELTTHRLIHKPWLRQRREYPLADLPVGEIKYDGGTARLRVKSIGLDMAFVGSVEQLRGALAVWCVLARVALPTPRPEAWSPWISWRAATHSGRKGTMFLLADQVAFVPDTFPPPSTRAAAATLAANLVTLPLGIAMVPSFIVPPIREALQFFHGAAAPVRHAILEALASLMGGWAVGAGSSRFTLSPGPGGLTTAVLAETSAADPVLGYVDPALARELARRVPTTTASAAASPLYRG